MGSTLCCLPLAPSVQCCLDRQHLTGNLPGAETGVWPRGAAVNIDPGGVGGGAQPCTLLMPTARPGAKYPIQQHPILGAAGRSTHSQFTVNSESTRQSTHSQLHSQLNGQRGSQILDLHDEIVGTGWSSGLTKRRDAGTGPS